MADFLVVKQARASTAGGAATPVTLEPGAIISDALFDIAALRSQGVSLVAYVPLTMDPILAAFRAQAGRPNNEADLLSLLISEGAIGGGGGVPSTRTLTAGAGLTGGGDLSADRTFDVGANADGSIAVNATDIQVGVLASDAQHGNRGGGALHADATTVVAGFMSAADKARVDVSASGPGASTDNAVARWDGTGGFTLQNSLVSLEDTGDLIPATNDSQDIGSDASSWAEVWSRQGVFVEQTGNGTITFTGTDGGLILGRAVGASGTPTLAKGGNYPPVMTAGNALTSEAGHTATLNNQAGGAVMMGSAFAGGAGTKTAVLISSNYAYGSFTGGYAFAYGASGANAQIQNYAAGSFLWAYCAPQGPTTHLATTVAGAAGAFVSGRTDGTGTSTLRAAGAGSFVQGVLSGTGTNTIESLAAADGGFAQGRANDGGVIQAGGAGGFAQGNANGGSILCSGPGGLAHGSTAAAGTIQSTASGAFAAGRVTSGTIEAIAFGAFAMGDANANTITASGQGSFALGDAVGAAITASGPGSIAVGEATAFAITASNAGSVALGDADSGVITASGEGSFAIGLSDTGAIVAGPANNTTQIGPGTNNTANSMQVGGDGTNQGFRALFTGQHGSPMSTLTLGVAVTTFAADSNVMEITGDAGTNTIATITAGLAGQLLTLIFTDGNVTITDDNTHAANTVDLSAAFTSADDTVLQLVYDGTSWYEVSRSVN